MLLHFRQIKTITSMLISVKSHPKVAYLMRLELTRVRPSCDHALSGDAYEHAHS